MSTPPEAPPGAAARRRSRSVRLGVLTLASVVAAAPLALGGRPPEVLEQERKEEALALDYLVRKSDSLSASLVDRRAHLRQRLRAMYKMSQGGYLRLLLAAESATDLFARRNTAERILSRDISELEAVREELGELRGLRERLREGEQKSAALLVEARQAERAGVGGEVRFVRPVRGKVVRAFGPYRDEHGLEFARDGVDLECRPGEVVQSPGPGAVRSVGEVAGAGLGVTIDHGDGWVSFVGNLVEPRARLGARLPAGFALGKAAGPSVHVELSQAGTWVDPTLFLSPPGAAH